MYFIYIVVIFWQKAASGEEKVWTRVKQEDWAHPLEWTIAAAVVAETRGSQRACWSTCCPNNILSGSLRRIIQMLTCTLVSLATLSLLTRLLPVTESCRLHHSRFSVVAIVEHVHPNAGEKTSFAWLTGIVFFVMKPRFYSLCKEDGCKIIVLFYKY